ncbi:MAG: hypothetical protein ACR2GN_00390 [Bacteroidia bacterium]
MEKTVAPQDLILEILKEKGVLKQNIYANTKVKFSMLKQVVKEVAHDLKKRVETIDKRLIIEFNDISDVQAELKVAGDRMVFLMHTNVFNFDSDHHIRSTSYISQHPENAYCGMIYIYNFLADSFKYNRLNDIGYLVGRLFINHEGHFFVEGKRQLGFLYNNIAHSVLDKAKMREVVHSVILYCLDFDLLSPPYDAMSQVTLEEIKSAKLEEAMTTGKRLGFRFEADTDIPD